MYVKKTRNRNDNYGLPITRLSWTPNDRSQTINSLKIHSAWLKS